MVEAHGAFPLLEGRSSKRHVELHNALSAIFVACQEDAWAQTMRRVQSIHSRTRLLSSLGLAGSCSRTINDMPSPNIESSPSRLLTESVVGFN